MTEAVTDSVSMPRGDRALSRGRAWGYGLGDFGINLYFITALTYLTYFYTDVFGLAASAVVSLLVVARLIDAFTDPVMGLIIDRTKSRWGSMRPYLLFGALPMGVLLVLVFTVPDMDDTGKLIWAYVTYILFGITFTVVGLPYSSLTARLTNDYDERTTLSTVRMACAFSGGLVVSVCTLWLVGLADNEAEGFRNTMLLYAVIATLFLWMAFKASDTADTADTAETNRVVPTLADSSSSSKQPLDLRPILENGHLWVVIGIFCCGMLGFTVRSAATPYYFKYYVQRPDLIPMYFLVTLGVMVVGLAAVPKIAEAMGKTRALYVGAAVTFVGCGLLYMQPADSIIGIFVAGGLISLGATPVAVLGWAMLPDTVEYAEWRHGVRADGLIYSTASFVQKLVKAAGGAAVAGMLAAYGYVANTVQDGATVDSIVGLMTWVPAIIVVPLIGFALMHKLDESTHRQIVQELAERQGATRNR